ncbi:MAG: hypothetical protein GY694_00450 [Gammaproteobacteria bacterium]|nr:hypothetical protein [Gammaproteobacteria bacterium]
MTLIIKMTKFDKILFDFDEFMKEEQQQSFREFKGAAEKYLQRYQNNGEY